MVGARARVRAVVVAMAEAGKAEVVVVGVDAEADALAVSGVSAMASVFARVWACAAGPSLAGRSLSLVPIPSSPSLFPCLRYLSFDNLLGSLLCRSMRPFAQCCWWPPHPGFRPVAHCYYRPRSWLPWSGRIAAAVRPISQSLLVEFFVSRCSLERFAHKESAGGDGKGHRPHMDKGREGGKGFLRPTRDAARRLTMKSRKPKEPGGVRACAVKPDGQASQSTGNRKREKRNHAAGRGSPRRGW